MRSSVLVALSLLIASSFLSCRRSAPQNDAVLIAPLKHDLQAGMTDGWFCNRSSIYADVDFAANALTNVRSQKISHCF